MKICTIYVLSISGKFQSLFTVFKGGVVLISILNFTSRFIIHPLSTEKQVMSFIMKGGRQYPI